MFKVTYFIDGSILDWTIITFLHVICSPVTPTTKLMNIFVAVTWNLSWIMCYFLLNTSLQWLKIFKIHWGFPVTTSCSIETPPKQYEKMIWLLKIISIIMWWRHFLCQPPKVQEDDGWLWARAWNHAWDGKRSLKIVPEGWCFKKNCHRWEISHSRREMQAIILSKMKWEHATVHRFSPLWWAAVWVINTSHQVKTGLNETLKERLK